MINYANPQGVGATAMPTGPANPMPPGANQQRNAITSALMNVANPAPRTMPGMGAGGGYRPDLSRPPNVLGQNMPSPSDPLNAAGAMPGSQPPGIMAQAGMAPSGMGAPPPGGPPMGGPPVGMGGAGPGPGAVMPPTPASGLPMGPQPNVPGLVGPQPLMQQPGSQLMQPGTNPGNY
jgi:hypothetical protein